MDRIRQKVFDIRVKAKNEKLYNRKLILMILKVKYQKHTRQRTQDLQN